MFGLSAFEILVLATVTLLLFHERLPRAAAELAGWIAKHWR